METQRDRRQEVRTGTKREAVKTPPLCTEGDVPVRGSPLQSLGQTLMGRLTCPPQPQKQRLSPPNLLPTPSSLGGGVFSVLSALPAHNA